MKTTVIKYYKNKETVLSKSCCLHKTGLQNTNSSLIKLKSLLLVFVILNLLALKLFQMLNY